MKSNPFFAKSFETDLVLKTVVRNKKLAAQSMQNILETGTIKPNTLSFGKQKRLACTVIHPNYLKTYRSHGLIFQTKVSPNIIYPFDVVLLTDAKKIVVQYYRIKDNLQKYYKHQLIKGSGQFAFKSFAEMLRQFPTPESAWQAVNRFRANAGYGFLPKPKHRLVEYCEAIFNKPIQIRPVAIYGYSKASTAIAKRFGLPHYSSAKKFYEKAMLKPMPQKRKKKPARVKPRRRK